jgi:hypothetical protein
VAVEVEVHPVLGAASFGALEKFAIEGASRGKVVHGKGEVEWRKAHDCPVRMNPGCCPELRFVRDFG